MFLAASMAYNADDLTAAERYYGELSVKTTGEDQATAYFWVGRLALQRGDQKTAAQAFAKAVEAAPDSYFAARSKDIIAEDAAVRARRSRRSSSSTTRRRSAQAEDWMRQTYDITQAGRALAACAGTCRTIRVWCAGANCGTLSAYDEAIAEFDDLVDANKDRRAGVVPTGDLLPGHRRVLQIRSSRRPTSSATRKIGTLDAPPYIARMRYPAYYLDMVQDVSARRNIDPLLLLSLIRHESLFDTYASRRRGREGADAGHPQHGGIHRRAVELARLPAHRSVSPLCGD